MSVTCLNPDPQSGATHQASATDSLRRVREILTEITDPLCKHRFTWSLAGSASSSLGGRLCLSLCGRAHSTLACGRLNVACTSYRGDEVKGRCGVPEVYWTTLPVTVHVQSPCSNVPSVPCGCVLRVVSVHDRR